MNSKKDPIVGNRIRIKRQFIASVVFTDGCKPFCEGIIEEQWYDDADEDHLSVVVSDTKDRVIVPTRYLQTFEPKFLI